MIDIIDEQFCAIQIILPVDDDVLENFVQS